jgi:hypothetical protein
VVFWWGFAKKWAQNVVFGWCERGELRGKRGELARTFVVTKKAPGFSSLFWDADGRAKYRISPLRCSR